MGEGSRDFVGYGAHPPHAAWPNGARVAVNIVINYEEGSEPSIADGDGYTETALTEGGGGGFDGRDLAAESMFEYGSRAGFWRLVRLLSERGLTATIFGCALALERNPAAAAEIVARGYDVCCHGYRWELHGRMSESQERERIRMAIESLTRTVGERPRGWYCRYSPGVNTRRLLVEEGGFTYDCDSYNDDLPYWVQVGGRDHLVVPYSLANNDTKLVRGAVGTGREFFEYLKEGFDFLYEEGATSPKMMSVGLHMRLVGHPARASGLARFLDHIAARPDVWICRRGDIADHWRRHHPPASLA
jgi:allantoinase